MFAGGRSEPFRAFAESVIESNFQVGAIKLIVYPALFRGTRIGWVRLQVQSAVRIGESVVTERAFRSRDVEMIAVKHPQRIRQLWIECGLAICKERLHSPSTLEGLLGLVAHVFNGNERIGPEAGCPLAN